MGFQKGQSGNPGGKPKELKGIQELARKHAPAAIAALVKVCTKGKSESARVSAAESLLSRAYGKPPQSIEHAGKNGGPIQYADLSKLSDDQLAALEQILGIGEAPTDADGGPGGEEA